MLDGVLKVADIVRETAAIVENLAHTVLEDKAPQELVDQTLRGAEVNCNKGSNGYSSEHCREMRRISQYYLKPTLPTKTF